MTKPFVDEPVAIEEPQELPANDDSFLALVTGVICGLLMAIKVVIWCYFAFSCSIFVAISAGLLMGFLVGLIAGLVYCGLCRLFPEN